LAGAWNYDRVSADWPYLRATLGDLLPRPALTRISRRGLSGNLRPSRRPPVFGDEIAEVARYSGDLILVPDPRAPPSF